MVKPGCLFMHGRQRLAASAGAGLLACGLALTPAFAGTSTRVAAPARSSYSFNKVTPNGLVRDLSGRHRYLHLEGHWRRVAGANGKLDAVRFMPRSMGYIPKSAELVPGRRRFAVAMTVKINKLVGPSTAHLSQLGFFKDAGRWKVEVHPGSGRVGCTFKGTLGQASVKSRRSIADGSFHLVVCFKIGGKIGVRVDQAKGHAVHRPVGRILNNRTIRVGNKSMRTTAVQLHGVVDYFAVAVGPHPIARATAGAPTIP